MMINKFVCDRGFEQLMSKHSQLTLQKWIQNNRLEILLYLFDESLNWKRIFRYLSTNYCVCRVEQPNRMIYLFYYDSITTISFGTVLEHGWNDNSKKLFDWQIVHIPIPYRYIILYRQLSLYRHFWISFPIIVIDISVRHSWQFSLKIISHSHG